MRIWGSMGMEIRMSVSMKVCQTDVNVLLGALVYTIRMVCTRILIASSQ
jgi:hypothetical protein